MNLPTCSSNLLRTNFRAANSAAFLFAKKWIEDLIAPSAPSKPLVPASIESSIGTQNYEDVSGNGLMFI